MKKLVTLLLILLMTVSVTEAQIGFGIFQDPTFAFAEDDYGNKSFTTDIRLEFDMQAFRGEYGAMVMGLTYEYADLSDFEFRRYGVQGGYIFSYMPFFWDQEYELTLLAGLGAIERSDTSLDTQLSLELTVQVDYYITDWLAFSIKSTLMQRGDLGARYGDKSGSYRPWDWKPNIYFGIKFRIPTYQPTKTGN